MPADPNTEALGALPREVVFDKLRLTVLKGADAGKVADSTDAEMTIGHEDNDLVLSDPAVSRYHCAIRAEERGFILQDLGSRNGTLLGSHRIITAYLEHGTTIVVGRTTVRFEVLSGKLREPLSPEPRYGSMVGRSAAIRRIFEQVARLATTDKTVLLLGEPGVGKSTLARMVHDQSARHKRPFEKVDCASLPAGLLANELFGNVKGAFTGASGAMGAFERANGGTLFLEEVGDLDSEGQKALLVAFDDKTIQRLGGRSRVRVDVRVVAATNRDLRGAVNVKTFRSDLFQRLNVFPIRIPPLRDRLEDVPLLVEHFYKGAPPPALVAHLQRRAAHLSVRELANEVERFTVLGWDGLEIDPSTPSPFSATADRGDTGASEKDFKEEKARIIAEWELLYLKDLLSRAKGNISEAARRAHVGRESMRDLIKKHKLLDAAVDPEEP